MNIFLRIIYFCRHSTIVHKFLNLTTTKMNCLVHSTMVKFDFSGPACF